MSAIFFTLLGLSKWTPWLLLLVLLIVWRLTKSSKKNSNLPSTPGIALPVVGHLYLMESNPRNQFAEWAQRLGPIFRLQFGSRTVIVLNGYTVLKEAFVRKAEYFSDRPHTFLCDVMAKNSGFVSSSPHWRNLRKVTVDIMRQLGTGTAEMEVRIQSEVTRFIETLRQTKGKAFDIRDLTAQCLSNIIGTLVFGKGFSPEDPSVGCCMRLIGDQVSLMEGAIVLNFLPFLRVLPGDCFGLRKASKIADDLDGLLAREIQKRKDDLARKMNVKELECDENTDDFITAFLERMEKTTNGEKGNNTGMDEKNLIGVLKSLFAAGTETTSSTICWVVLYLLHYPNVMQRCYQEISEAVGEDRLPSSYDRPKCRFTEATIMETQRMASISPFSIYHSAAADVHLNGYLIPKGAIVMPSLDSVLHSESIWGDPFAFRPERFLDEATNQIIRREELVPFSLGKRSCLGEVMAKQQMFLFVTSVIHQFNFQTDKGCDLPPLEYRFGLNCSPLPFKICFIPR